MKIQTIPVIIFIMLAFVCLFTVTMGEFDNTTTVTNETPVVNETVQNVTIVPTVVPTIAIPANPDIDGRGTLEILVRCANNVFSNEVLVTDSTGVRRTIYLNLMGKYEDRYFPGTYTIYLKDGNAGKPEQINATVYSGYQTRVPFLGHAISPRRNISDEVVAPLPESTINPECLHRPDHPGCVVPTIVPTPVPTEPTTNPECNHRPNHPGCPGYEQCVRTWHEGYWESERQWTCAINNGELSLSCCRWVTVPVWHDGYWTTNGHCTG